MSESHASTVPPGAEHAAWLLVWARRATDRRTASAWVGACARMVPMLAIPAALLLWRGASLPWVLLGVGAISALVAAAWAMHRRSRLCIGDALEARVPASRNLLHTALSLAAQPLASMRTDIATHALVQERARTFAQTLDVRAIFPLKTGWLALSVGLTVAALSGLRLLATPAAERSALPSFGATRATDRAAAFAIRTVRVLVTPPAYLGRPDSSSANPLQISVPAAARVQLTVDVNGADSVVLETSGARTVFSTVNGSARAMWRADRDDVLAVQAHRGDAIARTFLGVRVVADADPRVRITAPGRDLVLPRGDTVLRLVVNADDDHALSSLVLRYTKVSGSGERFSFVEGELPLTVRRLDKARWEARADWALAALALEPGDVVVYRAVATDRRPAAPAVESDAWIAEVMSGRGEGAAGFAVDVGELRYALSQQMIVMRIERLLVARDSLGAGLSDEAFAERARNIAVEQRRVRAEFVFLLGGELSEEVAAEDNMGDLNEHQHAEVDADLSTGRVRNEGRQAVQAAIRAMSRSATTLADTALAPALRHAREAVTQLEIAFTRARFLMRPLAERERIDLTRRLTGALSGVGSTVQPRSASPADAEQVALAAALTDLASLARRAGGPDDGARGASADRLQALAATVLRARSADSVTQAIALALNAAAVAVRRGDATRAQSARDQAARLLTQRLSAGAPASATQTRSADAARRERARSRTSGSPP